MKKITLSLLIISSLVLTGVSTWFLTKTYYKIQVFEIAKENFVYREVSGCEKLIIQKDPYGQTEYSKRIIEGCMTSVSMFIKEIDLEMDNIVFFDKDLGQAYSDAQDRAFEQLKIYYYMQKNPGVDRLVPQEFSEEPEEL